MGSMKNPLKTASAFQKLSSSACGLSWRCLPTCLWLIALFALLGHVQNAHGETPSSQLRFVRATAFENIADLVELAPPELADTPLREPLAESR